MATDIAFAVGVLALLGKRVPPALRILLLALAVIDDVGAIIVIAVFYSSGFSFAGLAVAALGIAIILRHAEARRALAVGLRPGGAGDLGGHVRDRDSPDDRGGRGRLADAGASLVRSRKLRRARQRRRRGGADRQRARRTAAG